MYVYDICIYVYIYVYIYIYIYIHIRTAVRRVLSLSCNALGATTVSMLDKTLLGKRLVSLYLVIHDSGLVSLNHLLLSRQPSVETTSTESSIKLFWKSSRDKTLLGNERIFIEFITSDRTLKVSRVGSKRRIYGTSKTR